MASKRPDLPCAGPHARTRWQNVCRRDVPDVSNLGSGPCRVITSEPCKEFPGIDAFAEADRAIGSLQNPPGERAAAAPCDTAGAQSIEEGQDRQARLPGPRGSHPRPFHRLSCHGFSANPGRH
jgi:hypothetical protein